MFARDHIYEKAGLETEPEYLIKTEKSVLSSRGRREGAVMRTRDRVLSAMAEGSETHRTEGESDRGGWGFNREVWGKKREGNIRVY